MTFSQEKNICFITLRVSAMGSNQLLEIEQDLFPSFKAWIFSLTQFNQKGTLWCSFLIQKLAKLHSCCIHVANCCAPHIMMKGILYLCIDVHACHGIKSSFGGWIWFLLFLFLIVQSGFFTEENEKTSAERRDLNLMIVASSRVYTSWKLPCLSLLLLPLCAFAATLKTSGVMNSSSTLRPFLIEQGILEEC